MELNTQSGEVKKQVTYSVNVKLTMTQAEMDETAAYQLTKKQIFEMMSPKATDSQEG